MKEKANQTPSRRALLHMGARSLAGAGLVGGLAEVAGANSKSDDRALVCIYLFGGEGGSHLPNVGELKALHRQGMLTVVNNVTPSRAAHASTPGEIMKQQYQGLRFLPNGFATLEWAARSAGINPLTGAGAFTFQSGMSLLSFDGREREGEQFENTALRSAMNDVHPLRTSFPDTTVGRQLKDVARLLQAGGRLGLRRSVFLCTANGFTSSAHQANLLAARYQELGQAIAAFYQATVELGLERQVTTYTESEFSRERARAGSRLVLGGAAMGDTTLERDAYSDLLAQWHGAAASELKQA